MTNQTRRNIIFTLYIVNDHPRVKPYYVSQTRKIEFSQAFYPINVLRDIGIEAIHTTHYLIMDIDVLPSDNLHSTLMTHKSVLQDHRSCLIFQLLQYDQITPCNSTKCFYYLYAILRMVTCSWNMAPRQKESAVKMMQQRVVKSHQNIYQVFTA